MRIVVLGYIVRGPLGGLVWHHLQYLLGLRQLHHELLFLEDSDDHPGCYNPVTFEITKDPTFGLGFLNTTFKLFGLEDNWSYYDAHTNKWFGKPKETVISFCRNADVVLNLSGMNPVRPWWERIPCRILVDTDPAFTQIRNLTDPFLKKTALQHTHFFSFGENIGNPGCLVPNDGIPWQGTRQPIYLDAWKISQAAQTSRWTTVMQWDSYPPGVYKNVVYGMKSLSFSKYTDLPSQLLNEEFELALGSNGAPAESLKASGWKVVNSLVPTRTSRTYQDYIAGSKGEWTVAKQGYVISNCGWFSERSCCYLASGKPVITQDTGFTQFIPTGKGLFSFTGLEEAVEAIEAVNSNYDEHCREARVIAEEYFDARRVLTNLLGKL